MALLDYAGTLRAGQSLVPDMRLQAMQDEQFAMQREERNLRRGAIEEARRKQEEARAQAEAFKSDFERVMVNGGKPDDITGLMLRYPGMMDQYKPVLERMDKAQLEQDITATGSIYSRLNAGDPQGAAAMLRKRVEADRAAGTPDPQDEALLSALESGDEREIKVAQSMIGTQLAAMTGVDTFKAVYGGNETKDPTQREYDWRVERFGKPAADAWLATEDTKLIAGQPGGKVLAFGPTGTSEVLVNGEGGDPSGSGAPDIPTNGPIGSWIEERAGLTASSRKRATGVKGTYHADDNARDFPTATIDENVSEGRRLKALFGPAFDVVYSETDKSGRHNDHVHVEPGPSLGAQIRGRGQVVAVKSLQQANALSPGTRYRTPDGREFVR